MIMMKVFIILIVGGISLIFWHKAIGTLSLLYLNPISYIIGFDIYLLCYIGLSALWLSPSYFSTFHGAVSNASEHSINIAFISFSYAIIVLPATICFLSKIFLKKSAEHRLREFFAKDLVSYNAQNEKINIFFWSIVLFLVIAGVLYIYIKYSSPFLALLSGVRSPTELREMRASLSGLNMSRIDNYINNLLNSSIGCVTTIVLMCYYKIYNSKKTKLLFFLSLLTSGLYFLRTGAKAPIVMFLFILFMCNGLIAKKIKTVKLILVSSILFFVIVILYAFYITGGVWNSSVSIAFFYRLFIAQIEGLPLSFELFPEKVPFLGIRILPVWMLAPFSDVGRVEPGTIRAIEYFNTDLGFMNTFFIADAWAYWGIFGLIISPVLVGVILFVVYNYILSRPKNPTTVALWGFMAFQLFRLTGGISLFVWNPMLIVILMLFLFRRLFYELVHGAGKRKWCKQRLIVNNSAKFQEKHY